MPTTANELFGKAGLEYHGTVCWGNKLEVPNDASGVYVVSLSAVPERNDIVKPKASFSNDALHTWIGHAKAITLDGNSDPSPESLTARLSQYWMPDESILYIGKGKKLVRRIGQYYSTKIGKGSPHHGGHWLKTLSFLEECYVHFALTENDEHALASEKIMLRAFADRVSDSMKNIIPDTGCAIPFANLAFESENGNTVRKQHKIGKSSSKFN